MSVRCKCSPSLILWGCGLVGLKFPGCGLSDFPLHQGWTTLKSDVSEADFALFEIHKINAFILLLFCSSLVFPKLVFGLGDPYAMESRLLLGYWLT